VQRLTYSVTIPLKDLSVFAVERHRTAGRIQQNCFPYCPKKINSDVCWTNVIARETVYWAVGDYR
jgi:hypothetical protein